jgi:ABC-type transport system involved in multi-copper enzyme maturation permease subunit
MKVTLPGVVRAEWTKLRALRSTWIVLGVTSLLVVGLAAANGWAAHRDVSTGGTPPTTAQAVGGALLGIDLLSLVIGVFGVLLMTGEYGSGLIRATLAAVPRRLPVLWAKAAVLVAVAAPVMVAACLAALLASHAFLGGQGVSLGEPGVLRAVFGAAAAAVAMGLLGLGVGAMLRHTAAAITTLVAAMLVIPALLPVVLPASVKDSVVPYVPTAASQAMYTIGTGNNPFKVLSPAGGAAVLAVWIVVVLAGGAAVLRRRDA